MKCVVELCVWEFVIVIVIVIQPIGAFGVTWYGVCCGLSVGGALLECLALTV